MALYVDTSVSFCFPHEADVSILRILMDLLALSFVILMCSVKFSFGSRLSPRIFGFLIVGMMVLFMVRFSVVLYSAGSGVKSVEVDFSGLSIRLFSFVHLKMSSGYGCRLLCAILYLVCEAEGFMSSA